jgi:hypothetical protein
MVAAGNHEFRPGIEGKHLLNCERYSARRPKFRLNMNVREMNKSKALSSVATTRDLGKKSAAAEGDRSMKQGSA